MFIYVHNQTLSHCDQTYLVDPVRVQDTQVGALATNTLLSSGASGTLVFKLADTLAGGFTVDLTLGSEPLAVSTTDTDTVDNVALLGFVSQTTCLVGARWAGGTVDDVQLPIFPAANTEQEAEDIRLLLLVELLEILIYEKPFSQ